jgi:predicted SAM-dependent methyltransferase
VEESPGGVGLHLGCGRHRWEGWVNVDIAGGDLQCDLRKLDLPDDHADVAVSVHVLEHFHAWEAPALLAEWRRVLKPSGKLVLELPCMDKVLNYIYSCIKAKAEIHPAMGWSVFWGDPKYKDPHMCHRWGYTKQMLRELLESVGFRDISIEAPRYHFEMRDMRAVAYK